MKPPRRKNPKRLATHGDIARALGVTQSTVSRALDPTQQHQIGQQMRDRILATAQRLGFRSNALARRLRTKRSETLTVVIAAEIGKTPKHPDFEANNPGLMWQEVHGIMHEAARRNYEVKLMPQFFDDPLLTRHFHEHIGYPFSDGVILAGLGLARQKAAARISETGIPCLATVAYPESLPLPLIAIDQTIGVQQALDALVVAGHRRIAFIAFAEDYATAATWRPRYGTFKASLSQAGLLDQAVFLGAPSAPALRDVLHRLPDPLPFTAAFCVNDAVAEHVMRILHERPQRVTVVGFDDNPLHQHPRFPFSSVALPLYDLGCRAVQRMIEHIEHPEIPLASLELIPTRYIPR